MLSLKETQFYTEVLKELNYPFANIYIFNGFVISEINEGVVFSWKDHAQRIVHDVSSFTGNNGSDIVYISHRINSYSLKPMDWLHFFKDSFNLKSYGVVGYNSLSFFNTVIENQFFKKKITRFKDLESAMQWAKNKVLVSTNE